NAGSLDPDQNPRRCFPQWYTDPADETSSGWRWFRKYVVGQVSESDLTGGGPDENWIYGYDTSESSTSVLWHHDNNWTAPSYTRRTWPDWGGYATVTTWHGNTDVGYSWSSDRFFRGLDGDRTDAGNDTRRVTATDSQGTATVDGNPLRGFLLEHTVFDNAP